MEPIICDDHLCIQVARIAVFGGIPRQRCQFRLQQNAQAYVPRQSIEDEVAEDLRRIFLAPNHPMVEMYLAETIKRYEEVVLRLFNWVEHVVP